MSRLFSSSTTTTILNPKLISVSKHTCCYPICSKLKKKLYKK